MKIMGIVAGRHNGNSEILTKEALSACRELGAECTLINLFDYKILPCTGCESCTMAMGKGENAGCVLKDKDDMERIVQCMHEQDGIIIGCPTYDLMPSATYTIFANRFMAYELSFLLKIGAVKHDPHLVAGIIANGGSCHDWQSLALESIGATMFTQSIQVVDQFMATRNGRPGNVILHPEQLERARKLGENVFKAASTPHEERTWLGDPDMGMCPNCHSNLIMRGKPHWNGVHYPYECPLCGAGGDLVPDETGTLRFLIAPDGLDFDRNKNECRDKHLDEITDTRITYFANQDTVKAGLEKYRKMTFKEL